MICDSLGIGIEPPLINTCLDVLCGDLHLGQVYGCLRGQVGLHLLLPLLALLLPGQLGVEAECVARQVDDELGLLACSEWTTH